MTTRNVTHTRAGAPAFLEVREKMRIVLAMTLLAVVALSGCAAGGMAEAPVEEGREAANNEAVLILVTPEGGNGYPVPDTAGESYPAAPVEAQMPTGYPEDTVSIPADEVDLSDVPTATTPDHEPQVLPAPGRPGSNANLSPGMMGLLAAITADLSAQTGVPAGDIHLVSAEPMVWANGALGCPAEGMAYIEVIIEGMVFTLEAEGDLYTYHTDSGQNYVLCVDGGPVSSGSAR